MGVIDENGRQRHPVVDFDALHPSRRRRHLPEQVAGILKWHVPTQHCGEDVGRIRDIEVSRQRQQEFTAAPGTHDRNPRAAIRGDNRTHENVGPTVGNAIETS